MTQCVLLNVIQRYEESQRPLADGALVVSPQLVNFAPHMLKAPSLSHAHREAGLVAAEVIANQAAVPAAFTRQAQEVSYMFAGIAVGGVKDHGPCFVVSRGAVAPQVSAMMRQCFLVGNR